MDFPAAFPITATLSDVMDCHTSDIAPKQKAFQVVLRQLHHVAGKKIYKYFNFRDIQAATTLLNEENFRLGIANFSEVCYIVGKQA